MKCVIQRGSRAQVDIDEQVVGKIGVGLMVLVGFEAADEEGDLEWMTKKLSQMRIFPDEEGNMNRSVLDIGGELLIVSQFTLNASTKKGNRPSFIKAAKPDVAIPLYERFKELLAIAVGKPVESGVFGAMMQVELINDGPVTIVIDSRNRE